ncbi:MAG: HU family DNA-binding protein [Candidatus Schekmanbacteria bacterium]|nr:HU family DNA-binding protein [Candidatus Schekmanbacteria bacterium]
MNKSDLVAKIAEDNGLSKAVAEGTLNSIMNGVRESLKSGDSVTLVGFGTFSVSERAARTGRNPQTGKEIEIAAKNVVKFKAGKGLKELV